MIIKKLITALLLISSSAAYCEDSFKVKSIRFKGLNRVTASKALLSIPIQIGDTVTSRDASNIIHALFRTGDFENIQVLKDENSLIIQVKERPIIENIAFFGNTMIKSELLKDSLESEGIKIGSILHAAKLFNIKKELENFYHSFGRYNATLKTIITSLPNNRVSLKLIFNEGFPAIIQQINIVGNHVFSDKKLVSFFQKNKKTFWWNKVENRQYQEHRVSTEIEALRSFYLDQGYIRLKINSIQLSLTPDKRNIYITLNLTEGDQYKIDKVDLTNDVTEYLYKIKQLVNLQPGNLYNRSEINKIESNIRKLLGNYGYAYPYITSTTEIDDQHKTVKIKIKVQEGYRFYVRRLYFEGNFLTKDVVLRREMRQMEGAWLNNNLVNQGKDRLNRLGYFENVDTEIRPVPGFFDLVDVIYKVKEQHTGSMNISVGFGTASGVNLQFLVQQDNWLGTGSYFGFSGAKNNYQNYASLSFTKPYITVEGISLGGNIFYSNFNANAADLSNYNLCSYGASTVLAFPVNETNTLHFNFNYVHNNLSNMKPQVTMWRYLNSIQTNRRQALPIYLTGKNIHFNTDDFFFSTGWIYNNLDRGYFPSVGSYLSLSGKITLPGSDNKYYKINFDASHYTPLNGSKDLIFMSRMHTGIAYGFSGKEAPFYDGFYAGGPSTIRGFLSNTIGPKATYFRCTTHTFNKATCLLSKSDDAIGGNALAIVGTELIIPTPFLHKYYSHTVRTSYFIEGGIVWDTRWENNNETRIAGIPDYSDPKKIRVSSGISLQWISPIGPLAFSYAQPIKRYYGDKSEQFQFNLGKTW